MNLEKQNKIESVLRHQNNIKFALLFGSEIKNKTRYGSDIDIAVYFDNDLKIHDIGELVIKLEKAARGKIDLVKLNNLDRSNPRLAYSILSDGLVVYLDDEISFKKFKSSVLLEYLDFKFTGELLDAAFKKRLSTNKFAVFDK